MIRSLIIFILEKFGIGRATYDENQEIRNKHISIKEGKKLIKKYDGEFSDRYFKEILNYIKLKPQTFFNYKINLDLLAYGRN